MFVCFLFAVCLLLVNTCCFLVFVYCLPRYGYTSKTNLLSFVLLCVSVLCCFCFLICCCFVVQFCCVCSFFKKWWWWCSFGEVVLGLPTTQNQQQHKHIFCVLCVMLLCCSLFPFPVLFLLFLGDVCCCFGVVVFRLPTTTQDQHKPTQTIPTQTNKHTKQNTQTHQM